MDIQRQTEPHNSQLAQVTPHTRQRVRQSLTRRQRTAHLHLNHSTPIARRVHLIPTIQASVNERILSGSRGQNLRLIRRISHPPHISRHRILQNKRSSNTDRQYLLTRTRLRITNTKQRVSRRGIRITPLRLIRRLLRHTRRRQTTPSRNLTFPRRRTGKRRNRTINTGKGSPITLTTKTFHRTRRPQLT